MANEAYELLAMLMRYVFVLIGVLILFRAYRWLRRDAKNYRREMKRLPDAGLVGEAVDLNGGKSYPLPREGTLGSASACDIRLRQNGVARRHASFAFENGKGLKITPHLRGKVLLDGSEVRGYAHAIHGSQLQIGDALLRIRLFAGLNVPHPVQYQQNPVPENEEEEWPGDEMPAAFPMPGGIPAMEQEEAVPAWPMPGEQRETPYGYAGNYTDDGQMTWEYAYSLEELNQAQQEMWNGQTPPDDADESDEPMPYQSPLPRRRRRGGREG